MRYADRERPEHAERRVERTRKTGERDERGRGRKSARICKGEGEQGMKVRGRERERERERILVCRVGDCEGHKRWCKGDGEAGGSASNEESQRLTKKKGRTLQFIDRPAVRAATRGVKMKKKERRIRETGKEGWSDIGSSEVVNGGRGRCEKSPRKKCARDEAKQRLGKGVGERVRGWRGIYERREIAGDDPTGALFLSFFKTGEL